MNRLFAMGLVAALGAAGCGTEDDPTGVPEVDAAGPVDAGGAVPDPARACDPGTPPVGAAALTGEFVFYGGDSGTEAPAVAGGTIDGSWTFRHITFYIPDDARAQLDGDASTVSGEAWAEMDAGHYRLSIHLDLTLETFVAGTIRQESTVASRGTYSVHGSVVVLESQCLDGGDGDVGMLVAGFTEADGEGHLVLEAEAIGGNPAYIVLDGSRSGS